MPELSRPSSAEVSRLCELIHDRSGLDFPPSRLADLEQVIADTLVSAGLPDVEALVTLLADGVRGEPVLHEMIVDLTINETYFFRNQPQFHALEHHILPELIAQRRPSRQLRIWSAGCATGEEPFSLAILLERLLPDLADWNIHLLATDINTEVLAKAAHGSYGEWSFRHVAPEIKQSYFAPRGIEFELVPRLRSRVTFARLNLADDAFPSFLTQTSGMDLILCRNVLIYFRPATVRRIVGRFQQALVDGGWLIVGHAEPSQTTFAEFTARNFPGTVVYQKSARVLRPAHPEATVKAAPRTRAHSLNLETRDRRRSTGIMAGQPIRQDARGPGLSPYDNAKQLADRMQWAEAEEWIARALEKEPLSAPAHYLHGLILLERGQPEAALGALRSCVFADPGFVMGHLAQADLLGRHGQAERGRKSLETAARLLAGKPANELVPEGDGLNAGRLLEMVIQRKRG